MSYITHNGDSLTVTLPERLDATLAPELLNELQTYVGRGIARVVIRAERTEYLSSAGIRAFIFAKQRLGEDTELILVKPQAFIIETLTLTGLMDYISVVDEYAESPC